MDMKLSNWDLLISIPIKVSIYIRLSEQLADIHNKGSDKRFYMLFRILIQFLFWHFS